MPTNKTLPHERNGHSVAPSPPPGKDVGRWQYPDNGEPAASPDFDSVSAWCKRPDLIGAIQADIAALGVVGEENNSLLMYLTGTSRLRRNPLRLIIRGSSGAGKSHPLEKVASLFPAEEVIRATSLTPQALYYGAPGWLEHKLILGGERSHRTDEEAADATAALRQLISEDRISKQVTANVGGKLETQTVEQNGPIAFVQTTTAKSIFAEDQNRCLQTWADESQEQTERILQVSARAYTEPSPADVAGILERHRRFQLLLGNSKDISIVIPFAETLARRLPKNKLESRRMVKLVLATIETIAFLHLHQRDRDSEGRLVATSADYDIARRLLLTPLNESIGVGDRAWKAFRALSAKFPKQQFTSSQPVEAGLFNNKMTCNRALKDLEALGVINCVAIAKGKIPARWSWTTKTISPVLPLRLA